MPARDDAYDLSPTGGVYVQKQITILELVRLLVALPVGLLIDIVVSDIAFSWLPETEDIVTVMVFLVGEYFAPEFLAILLACLVPTWRYKTIAATIIDGVTIVSSANVLLNLEDLMTLLWSLIGFSASLSGALAAVMAWGAFKDMHSAKPHGQA